MAIGGYPGRPGADVNVCVPLPLILSLRRPWTPAPLGELTLRSGALPLTINGKIDRKEKALKRNPRPIAHGICFLKMT